VRRVRLAALVCAVACLAAGSASAATYFVDPLSTAASDENPGSQGRPLKTISRALALAKGGDTVFLASADYPAVAITGRYSPPTVLKAADAARPVFTGGLSLRNAEGVRISGITFTWRDGTRPGRRLSPFVEIAGCRDIEVSGCEICDDASRAQWAGTACQITDSDSVVVRDTRAHHIYFGFVALQSKNVVFRNLDIRLWQYEDGIRTQLCEGPVLIEGCHITNTGEAIAETGGHVDGYQCVYWSDNITIRNNIIHGVPQAIGVFSSEQRRRKNWRVEGNLIYDVYTPHICTICDTDTVVVVNNTFPTGAVNLFQCTAGVVKNNIFGRGTLRRECIVDADSNLWVSEGTKIGEHDLLGVDPKFASAPVFFATVDWNYRSQCTTTKFYCSGLKGKVAVGDEIEVVNSSGSPRTGQLRKVVAIEDNWYTIDPPLDSTPPMSVLIYLWPKGHRNTIVDYRLTKESPAVDSGDGDVERGKDAFGNVPCDVPDVPNTGKGKVPYLDRGAFEYVPEAKRN